MSRSMSGSAAENVSVLIIERGGCGTGVTWP
jgi:hypothetical protein